MSNSHVAPSVRLDFCEVYRTPANPVGITSDVAYLPRCEVGIDRKPMWSCGLGNHQYAVLRKMIEDEGYYL